MIAKRGITFCIALIIALQFASAVDLDITSRTISGTIINDFDEPAVFELTIKNNGDSGIFEIFTFERFTLNIKEFELNRGETKKIILELQPLDTIKTNEGFVPVQLTFRQKERQNTTTFQVTPKLVFFEKAFSVTADEITLDSKKVQVNLFNIENIDYNKIKVVFSSNFFSDFEKEFELKSYEKKTFEIPINEDRLKQLVYGGHQINARISVENNKADIKGWVQIVQRTGVVTTENSSGLIIKRVTIEKINEGNVPSIAEISIRKNIISRLFTTFSTEPRSINRDGFFVYYAWQKELAPTEKLTIKTTTNWFLPIGIILGIIAIFYIASIYLTTNLVIKKNINFVKTKNNDFALKVTIRVKARKFMERVTIYEKLPGLAKLYEQFTGINPTKVDKDRGLLRWDLPHLAKGEERMFSYIMYSKVKIVGKFELPATRGVYEIQGKIHESKSNRVFFINEPQEKKIEQDTFFS